MFSAKYLVFETPLKGERCATISVADNNIKEGSRSYHLTLRITVRSVLVRLHPKVIPIIVIDDDGQGKSTIILLYYTLIIGMHAC